MAIENQLVNVTIPAGSDLSSSQYLFMDINSSGQLALPSNGAEAVGVLQNKPSAAGRAGTVAIAGVSKITWGGTVAAGALVMTNGSGKAVTATSGNRILGIAVDGGSSGAIGSIVLVGLGRVA